MSYPGPGSTVGLRQLLERAMATEMPRQCAWCGRVVERYGGYSTRPHAFIAGATHGICPPCKGIAMARTGLDPVIA